MRQKAEPGENVKMKLMISAADEKEDVRAFAILRTEEDRPDGTSDGQKRILEEIRVVIAWMQKRRTAACGGRCRLLAALKLGKERARIIDKARGPKPYLLMRKDTGS